MLKMNSFLLTITVIILFIHQGSLCKFNIKDQVQSCEEKNCSLIEDNIDCLLVWDYQLRRECPVHTVKHLAMRIMIQNIVQTFVKTCGENFCKINITIGIQICESIGVSKGAECLAESKRVLCLKFLNDTLIAECPRDEHQRSEVAVTINTAEAEYSRRCEFSPHKASKHTNCFQARFKRLLHCERKTGMKAVSDECKQWEKSKECIQSIAVFSHADYANCSIKETPMLQLRINHYDKLISVHC
ncbi:Uncharacterised protein at_DN2633 [Pycnogonum litorale]